MEQQEIFERVKQVIQGLRNEDLEVTPQLSLQDDLGADSVELMEFIIAVEDEFSIEISDEDADQLSDVASLVALVAQKK